MNARFEDTFESNDANPSACLVMEVVVDRDVCARRRVDSEHVLVEGGSMAVVIVVAVCDEEVRVNHLVQEGLDKVLSRPQLEQWHRKSDGAKTPAPLVTTQPGADGHSGRPLDLQIYRKQVLHARATLGRHILRSTYRCP